MSIANPFCLINNQWRRDIHSHAPTQTQTNDAGERKWSGHYSDYTHSIHRNHTKQLKSLPQTTPPTTTLSIQTRYSASNNSEMSQAQHSNCWDWIFEHIPFMPQFVLFLSLPLWHNRNKKKKLFEREKIPFADNSVVCARRYHSRILLFAKYLPGLWARHIRSSVTEKTDKIVRKPFSMPLYPSLSFKWLCWTLWGYETSYTTSTDVEISPVPAPFSAQPT